MWNINEKMNNARLQEHPEGASPLRGTKNFIFVLGIFLIIVNSLSFVSAVNIATNFTSANYGGSSFNFLIPVNNTRFLLSYHTGSYSSYADGYTRTVDVNSTYGATIGGSVSYTAYHHSWFTQVAQIDSSHFVILFSDDSNKYLRGTVVEVLSNGTVIVDGKDNLIRSSLSYMGGVFQIEANTFLIVYKSASAEYARVIKAYANGTVNAAYSEVQFDSSGSGYPALEQIDTNHYLVSYGGLDDDAYAMVLTAYANGTVVAGSAFESKDASTNYDSALRKIDSTHYLSMQINNAQILGVYTNNWTVYNVGSSVAYYNGTQEFTNFDLNKMNANQFFAMYAGYTGGYLGYYPGQASVIAVNTSSWTISVDAPYEFTSGGGNYDSIEKIDVSHYIGAYSDSSPYGYIQTFAFTGVILDSCECPGLNQNWVIDLTKYCVITTTCDIGTGVLSFTGAGNATIFARVDAKDLTAPGAGGAVYLTNTGSIYLG